MKQRANKLKALVFSIIMVTGIALSLTGCVKNSTSVTTPDNNSAQNQDIESLRTDEQEEMFAQNDNSEESEETSFTGNNCEFYYSAQSSVNNSGLSVGDTFILGNYEITSVDWNSRRDRSETSLKTVPLEWRILEINGSQAVAIPIYLLRMGGTGTDSIPFANDFNRVARGELTWENSSIREWLNDDFYINAFSELEKNTILTTPVKNNGLKDYGNVSCPDTFDNVYLFSYEELLKYMPKSSYKDGMCVFYGDVGMTSSELCTRTVTIDTIGINGIVHPWDDGSISFTGSPLIGYDVLPVISVDLNKL